MPSIVSHMITGASLSYSLYPDKKKFKLYFFAVLISIIPDFDVIMFRIGIPYSHPMGHRGFFHSFLFAAIAGIFLAYLFFNKYEAAAGKYIKLSIVFILIGIMHGILDAMTNGGLGIGLLIPFKNQRFFLPWKPIEVSPIDIASFFSNWGLKVLKNEFIFLIIPSIILIISTRTIRFLIKYYKNKSGE